MIAQINNAIYTKFEDGLRLTRQGTRLAGFFTLLLSYVSTAGIVSLCLPWPFLRRKVLVRIIQFHSKATLKLLGIHVELKGAFPDEAKNYFVVSNHMSYIDILIISAHKPCCFVTSMEIRQTPFLGLLTELGGCLYVERRSREQISSEVKQISQALDKNLNVCIFPEATSTNGEELLRFRRPLYTAAIQSSKPVLPLCINYQSIDSEPVRRNNRDLLCWYDDMDFFPHLTKMMGVRKIEVRLCIDEEISPIGEIDTQGLADTSFQRVQKNFVSIQ